MTIILILLVVYGNLKETNSQLSVSTDNSLSFKFKTNFIGNIPNGGRKNGGKIAVPLKYLSNFWRSLEMPLINCKFEVKLKWTKNCLLSAAGNDNTNTNLNNIIFTIKDAKLYFPFVTLSAKDN